MGSSPPELVNCYVDILKSIKFDMQHVKVASLGAVFSGYLEQKISSYLGDNKITSDINFYDITIENIKWDINAEHWDINDYDLCVMSRVSLFVNNKHRFLKNLKQLTLHNKVVIIDFVNRLETVDNIDCYAFADLNKKQMIVQYNNITSPMTMLVDIRTFDKLHEYDVFLTPEQFAITKNDFADSNLKLEPYFIVKTKMPDDVINAFVIGKVSTI